MPKRFFIFFILAALSVFVFSACTKRQQVYHIGVSQCSDDLWRKTMNDEMELEASLNDNIKLEIKSAKDNTQQQIKDIRSLIDEKVDLLIVSPNESDAVTPVIKQARQKGIPVILVDRKINSDDYTAYVGADNFEIGNEAGIYVAERLKGKGRIAIMRGWKGSTSDTERYLGFLSGISNYPQIHIVAERYGNFLEQKAELQMDSILTNDANLDLVFALNDPMAMGVYNALNKYSGKHPYVIGIDALPGKGGGIDNIRKGIIDASFIYPTGGETNIDLAIKILKKEPFKRENTLYTAVVDKKNARVIQLQGRQIQEHQAKLEAMNDLLKNKAIQYYNQQALFYATICILILITILLVVSIIAYTNKSKSNRMLYRQKEQLETLSQQLTEATNAKLTFFTNISHEFKTPLALILGPIKYLAEVENLTTEQQQMLDLIKRNSDKLQYLISELIEFRKYENGKSEAHFVQSDIVGFLENINSLFKDLARRKKIMFSFESALPSFIMPFDKEKFEKIYFNLLSNALKYANVCGTVSVHLTTIVQPDQERSQAVQLRVTNTGHPIPADKIDKIFIRFYKVNPYDAGTGIGLAIVDDMVKIHGGEIRVESNEKTTSFIVSIPTSQQLSSAFDRDEYAYFSETLLKSEESILPETKFELDDAEQRKPLVLIIEDNPDMRHYLKMVLHKAYNLLEAEDGKRGLEMAKKFIPDLIISDVLMPEENGFEVCRKIKTHVVTSHIPVILLTACSIDEQKAIGFECGADAYIVKPFNADLLNIRMRKLIESRENLRQLYGKSLSDPSTDTVGIPQNEQHFIRSVTEYIRTNISEPTLSVTDIAQQQGMSRVQLYRKLKALTNNTPNELIKITRLQFAAELLAKNSSITDAAYNSGFSSVSYFSKCFKDFYKTSPTDYIK